MSRHCHSKLRSHGWSGLCTRHMCKCYKTTAENWYEDISSSPGTFCCPCTLKTFISSQAGVTVTPLAPSSGTHSEKRPCSTQLRDCMPKLGWIKASSIIIFQWSSMVLKHSLLSQHCYSMFSLSLISSPWRRSSVLFSYIPGQSLPAAALRLCTSKTMGLVYCLHLTDSPTWRWSAALFGNWAVHICMIKVRYTTRLNKGALDDEQIDIGNCRLIPFLSSYKALWHLFVCRKHDYGINFSSLRQLQRKKKKMDWRVSWCYNSAEVMSWLMVPTFKHKQVLLFVSWSSGSQLKPHWCNESVMLCENHENSLFLIPHKWV